MAITACRIFPALERLKHKDPETLASQYSLREKNIKEKKWNIKRETILYRIRREPDRVGWLTER